MGKNKLKRFAELAEMSHVIQSPFEDVFRQNHSLKGNWNESFFKSRQPIVLELGCGKGEYTVNLAKKFPQKNFLGVDIKGARIWKGAKKIQQERLTNAGFLRTRIELIDSFFAEDEISEIWLTFPDPQLKKARIKKRLTAPGFLKKYQQFLIHKGTIHLKTDNQILHNYTKQLIGLNNLPLLVETNNLYASDLANEILSIQTYYEKEYLKQGIAINYISFQLPKNSALENISGNK